MPALQNLQRFLDAQKGDYQTALAEIKSGRKRSHWMWYIFPQIQGLGHSETARFYAIKGRAEAEAYLQHPELGSRLVEICQVLVKLSSNDSHGIFGSPDDLKLKSSMTLFDALNTSPVFKQVLDKFYQGARDEKTLQLLGSEQ